MPVATDKLSEQSSDAAIKAAISDCIQYEINHGKKPDEAKGMCYGMARDKTGKELGKVGGK